MGDLPAVPDPGVLDGTVVNGAPAPPAARKPLPPAVVLAARHGGYVAAGTVVAARRWHHRRTRHERMMRAAEASGNREEVLKWAQQAEHERHQRAQRRRDAAEVLVMLVKAAPWIFGAWLAGMVALGLLIGIDMDSLYGFAVPWLYLAHAAAFLLALGSALWAAATVLVPLGVLARLHHLGRTAGDLAPGWTVTARAEEEGRGLVVTADTIVLALKNVQVTPLRQAIKEGWQPSFTLLPVKDGRGYSATFSLPLGVTPQMIADQRPVLARNLHRDEIEVWPSAGPPGHASLWVADPGAIGNAAPEYPLLHEGEADVFRGVPGGVIARGDGALIPVVEANIVLGGLPGQGKSNAARVIMLGCATDPLCALDVFVFANNGDFDAYAPRLAVYRKGLDDDVIAAAVARLQEAYEDVGFREQRLADLGAKKVTRQLAEQYPELRPRVSLFSECHELFGHPEHGELAGELAVKTVKRGRKTGRAMVFDTQSSRKAAIPPALVELVSVNVCFAVKSWRNNDGFLGDGSFAAGIRATELRPKRDRGTALVTGVSDEQFELLRWYYVEADDDTGYDAAADVIARAMEQVAPGTPVAGSVPAIEAVQRDLLADLAEVTRGDSEPVRLADLARMLQRLAPLWLPYRGLTGERLKALLDGERVRWTNTGNVPRLDPMDLHRVLREREGGEDVG